MKVVKLGELPDDSVTSAEGWTSRRLLLAKDKMGFSLHDTLIHEGAELHLHYANHLEAVYCIEGKGSVTVEATGKTWEIEPGTVYALDQNDKHILKAESQMRMVCVFNPPIIGKEVHDENGVYPLMAEERARVTGQS
jgi:L-ectoine synthase